VLKRALKWSLSWARSIQSISTDPISLRAIIILSLHERQGLSFWLSHQNPMRIPIPTRATCPVHIILPGLILLIILDKEYKLWRSSLCNFLQPPVTSFLFSPNIPLSTLFSNKVSLAENFTHLKYLMMITACVISLSIDSA
jgi:hypothetical protein